MKLRENIAHSLKLTVKSLEFDFLFFLQNIYGSALAGQIIIPQS
jgi:hypothetical protein